VNHSDRRDQIRQIRSATFRRAKGNRCLSAKKGMSYALGWLLEFALAVVGRSNLPALEPSSACRNSPGVSSTFFGKYGQINDRSRQGSFAQPIRNSFDQRAGRSQAKRLSQQPERCIPVDTSRRFPAARASLGRSLFSFALSMPFNGPLLSVLKSPARQRPLNFLSSKEPFLKTCL